jgi:DNA polymerase
VVNEDLRALARALASRLRHDRAHHGVSYVRDLRQPAETASAPTASASTARPAREEAASWPPERKLAYLRERNVGDCRRCALSRTRSRIVFGVGDPRAPLMFVGEAPGAEEDRRGEPFVGAAGRRLDQWIEAIGFRRADVYIANVLKCRPPGNRDPAPEEVDTCSPFLWAQVRAIEPRVIVALGRFAGALLLGRSLRMYEMRGRVHDVVRPEGARRIPLVVTYHPSYVLRSERGDDRGPEVSGARKSENEVVLADLRMVRELLAAASRA